MQRVQLQASNLSGCLSGNAKGLNRTPSQISKLFNGFCLSWSSSCFWNQLAASQGCLPSVSPQGSLEGSPHLGYLLPVGGSMTGRGVWKNRHSGRIRGHTISLCPLEHTSPKTSALSTKCMRKGSGSSVCLFGPSICCSGLSLLPSCSTLLSPQAIWITWEYDSTCRSLKLMRSVRFRVFQHLLTYNISYSRKTDHMQLLLNPNIIACYESVLMHR